MMDDTMPKWMKQAEEANDLFYTIQEEDRTFNRKLNDIAFDIQYAIKVEEPTIVDWFKGLFKTK